MLISRREEAVLKLSRQTDYGGTCETVLIPLVFGLTLWSVWYDDGCHFGGRRGVSRSPDKAKARARQEVVYQHYLATA